jgi:hypothetical protein
VNRLAGILAVAGTGALAALAAASCGPVTGPDGNHARISIEAPGEVSVRVVVSRIFGPAEPGGSFAGQQILLDGDTVWVDVPVSESYDIQEMGRFFIEVMAADPDDVPVNLRVWIDDRQEYDHARPLSEGVLRYVFVRNH